MAVAAGALLCNWLVFPRIGARQIWRAAEEERGYAAGILLYPLSVAALVLLFRHELWKAAAVWGVLALGDGMATLVGQALRGPRLFWNSQKSWPGLLAMVGFGTLAAAVLIAWTRGESMSAAIVFMSLGLAIACAWAESLPTTLDDNFTVPLVGAVAVEVLSHADPSHLGPGWERLAAFGLAVNAVFALGAWAARTIDVPGALSAVVIGTLIVVGFGLRALALMMVFFVLGTTVTRLGHGIKTARGIAQEKGGARGWRNAWANGGIPATIALFGALAAPALRPVFLLAYAASVASAAADTCSSEIGKAYGRRTFLIATGRAVPPGTEGAVSVEGSLAAIFGAAAVAATGTLLGLFSLWGAGLVAAAGVLGCFAESVLGTVAEKRGWMGNDLLNVFNTAVGAGLMVALVRIFSAP